MDTTEKALIGSPVVLGVNAGIQYLVAGAPFKTVSPAANGSIRTVDLMALGLELGASAGALALLGPVPAVLGAVEALSFFGLGLAGVGRSAVPAEQPSAPAQAPVPAPAPVPAESKPSSRIEEYVQKAKSALPMVNQLFEKIGLGQPEVMIVRERYSRV